LHCGEPGRAPQPALRGPPAAAQPSPLLSLLPWLIRPRVPALPWIAGIRLAAACSSSARCAAELLWNPSEPTCPPWAVASCQGLGWRASSCLASRTLSVLRSAWLGVTFLFAAADFFAAFLVACLDTVFPAAFFAAF